MPSCGSSHLACGPFLVPSLQHDIHVPRDGAVLPGEAWKAARQDLETDVSCRYAQGRGNNAGFSIT